MTGSDGFAKSAALPVLAIGLVCGLLSAGPGAGAAAETWRAEVAAAGAAYGRGEYRAAEGKLKAALAAVRQSYPDGPEVGTVLNNLAIVYETLGQLDEAERLLRDAIAVWRRTLGPEHANLARSLSNLAELHQVKGEPEQSEAAFRQALAVAEANAESAPAVLRNVLDNYAKLLVELGRGAEAEALRARSTAVIYLEKN